MSYKKYTTGMALLATMALQACNPSQGLIEATPKRIAVVGSANDVCVRDSWRCQEVDDVGPAWDGHQNVDMGARRFLACAWALGGASWEDNDQQALESMAASIKDDLESDGVTAEMSLDFDYGGAKNQNLFNEATNEDSRVRVFIDSIEWQFNYEQMVYVEILDDSLEVVQCQ